MLHAAVAMAGLGNASNAGLDIIDSPKSSSPRYSRGLLQSTGSTSSTGSGSGISQLTFIREFMMCSNSSNTTHKLHKRNKRTVYTVSIVNFISFNHCFIDRIYEYPKYTQICI